MSEEKKTNDDVSDVSSSHHWRTPFHQNSLAEVIEDIAEISLLGNQEPSWGQRESILFGKNEATHQQNWESLVQVSALKGA